jgi:hypothetical protein
MHQRFLRAAVRLGLAGVVCGLVACNPYGDLCKAQMDCEGGNDKDVDACVANWNATSDAASLWDCDEWFDAYVDCVEQSSYCENRNYGVHDHSCDAEEEDLGACGNFN